MGLFSSKCTYCTTSIESEPIIRAVKRIGMIGTKPMKFCSEEHADSYEQEMKEYSKKPQKSGGGCCG